MGRTRQPIEMKQEKNGKCWVAYFWHPLRHRTERIALGESQEPAGENLKWLNLVFLHDEHWHTKPKGIPQNIWDAWLGSAGDVTMKRGGKNVIKGKEEVGSGRVVFKLKMQIEYWKQQYESVSAKLRQREKELEHWKGGKIRTGPAPTLAQACRDWVSKYKGRDGDHSKIVAYDLWRFVDHFDPPAAGADHGGEMKDVDEFVNRERDIDSWLRSIETKEIRGKDQKVIKAAKPIGAGRRAQIRRHVLRFLEDSGVTLQRKQVTTVKKKDIRAGRGQIRWLERDQAEKTAANLPAPWSDIFRIQVAMGLRPDELITLKRADFSPDLDRLTLTPLKHLTLKNGSRTVRVPTAVQKIVKQRLEAGDVLFPDPETKEPWSNPKDYNWEYNSALKTATAAAGVAFKVDCRVGRRTCASLLLRAGRSVEEVASILGDDPATIREHYAAILPHEVDPTPAALKEANQN